MSVEVSSLPSQPAAPSLPGAATDDIRLAAAAREANVCANCGQSLHGPFCSNCGQHIGDFHRSIWRFVADFADNAFCWDNKVFRTLQPLVTRPGEITLDYLAGKRARYVHPLRLFLFTSAVCLTIIQYLGDNPSRISIDHEPDSKKHHPGVNFHFGTPSPAPVAAASPAPGNRARNFQVGDPSPPPAADSASPAPAAAAPDGTAAPVPAEQAHGDDDDDDGAGDADPVKGLADELDRAAGKVRAAAPAPAQAAQAAATPRSDDDFGDRIARKAEARINADGGAERLQKEITNDLQRRVSYVALALLPIFAVMLRSLYWRRDGYYFAHLIFSLHYHTFLLLFIASYTLVQLVLPTSFWPVRTLLHATLLLGPGVYLFLALRRLYGEGIQRSLTKVCLLGGMHLVVLFIGLAVVGGLAIYRALA